MSNTMYRHLPGARLPRPRALERLCESQVMDRLVRRETARADRTGRAFSLVLFRVNSGSRGTLGTRRLARILLKRARVTDEIGWFAQDYLCALLTETPALGARVFADRVCDAVARRGPRPLPVVYSYPDTNLKHDRPTDDDLRLIITSDPTPRKTNGNQNAIRTELVTGHANGNGHSNGNGSSNGNGHANGNGNTVLLTVAQTPAQVAHKEAPRPIQREDLIPLVSRAIAAELDQPGLPTSSLHEMLIHPLPRWKRIIDIIGALIGLVLVAPLMAMAGIGIRLTSPGPIIFSQRRAGLGGKPFTIYKFRTMVVGADARKNQLRQFSEQDGPAFKMEHDPRLTPFGRFLRKTSIDELPQFVNVLKGDMSLVGPRPLPVDESDACQPWQRRRLDVTPGLTCIWQVKGRSTVTFDEWVRMDVEYIRRRTVIQDLWILVRTVPAVLLRRGAR